MATSVPFHRPAGGPADATHLLQPCTPVRIDASRTYIFHQTHTCLISALCQKHSQISYPPHPQRHTSHFPLISQIWRMGRPALASPHCRTIRVQSRRAPVANPSAVESWRWSLEYPTPLLPPPTTTPPIEAQIRYQFVNKAGRYAGWPARHSSLEAAVSQQVRRPRLESQFRESKHLPFLGGGVEAFLGRKVWKVKERKCPNVPFLLYFVPLAS